MGESKKMIRAEKKPTEVRKRKGHFG